MATNPPTAVQPKISQKLLLRTLICLIILGLCFLAYRWYSNQKGDYNGFGSSNTFGLVSAIERKDDGSEAVIIKPSGDIVGTTSWKAPANDEGLTWRPDGRFLFFSSDRKDNTFHIYRWNPDQDDAEARTTSKRSCTNPTFPAEATSGANDSALIISGGTVQSLDPKTQSTPQILPPVSATVTTSKDEENGGQEGLFQSLYGGLGTSFRLARWCFGGKYIVATMEREGGEVLVLQDMQPNNEGKLERPIPVAAGDRVEFDVSPKDGSVAYDAQGFRWPAEPPKEFVKNNKVTTPFRHVLGLITYPQGANGPKIATATVALSPDDKNSFGSLAISPDGSTLLVTVGPYDASTESMSSKGLLTMPLQGGGIRSASPLVQGEVYEPSWSPDGNTVAFAMRAGGKRDIYTIHKDGTAQTNLTKGKGDFSNPRFSPQLNTGQTP